ncbi:transmembrane protein 25 [Mastacembelus armatus]|uniref:transmembrane protein 25 n=1 Tax=Mastacembelus armatus TaxID=205130 RepID=UPI000E457836|nr:transmembrane protein 25 [Mastacembelus armatus]
MELHQAESHRHLQKGLSMDRLCVRRWASGSAVMLLQTLALSWAGAIKSTPKIDGRHRAAVTLQENVTHRFNCQSDGWDPHAPPLLTWYLDGKQQKEPSPNPGRLVMTSQEDSEVLRPGTHHNSTFSLRARKWDRELVCVASNPRTGKSYNATVTLNVQFQPEILRVNAHYSETSDPGLSLVLFALVRSNPPATITFVDQSGQLVANTSDFLILDSRSYPWLANHTLRVTLSSLSGNISLNASNSVGTVQSNLTLAEFLQSRVEVPMLGIVTGGAMAFMALLILSLIVLCLMQKNNKSKSIDEPVEILMTKKSESASLQAEKANRTHIPRENMSLPSNVQLNDLSTLRKARAAQKNSVGENKKEEEEEEDLSLAYAARGFARYPMVGYIYKVNSTSSEEIWL